MLSSHRTTTRVDFEVQRYAFFSIPTPFLDKVLLKIMNFNELEFSNWESMLKNGLDITGIG